MKDHMIRYMEMMKSYRLTRERRILLQGRRTIAANVWHTYQLAHPPAPEDSNIQPSPADFLEFRPVKSIIEGSSITTVTKDSFDGVLPLLSDWIRNWQEEAHWQLYKRILPGEYDHDHAWTEPPSSLPKRTPKEVRRKLSLATTIFECERPAGWSVHAGPMRNIDWNIAFEYIKTSYQGMFYPEFLHHECNIIRTMSMEEVVTDVASDKALVLGHGFERHMLRRPWSCKHLRFDQKASDVAAKVVKACGLDPGTASVQDMDNQGARLVCLKCTHGEQCDGERTVEVRPWRNAVSAVWDWVNDA
jgi:hypothetical protein